MTLTLLDNILPSLLSPVALTVNTQGTAADVTLIVPADASNDIPSGRLYLLTLFLSYIPSNTFLFKSIPSPLITAALYLAVFTDFSSSGIARLPCDDVNFILSAESVILSFMVLV